MLGKKVNLGFGLGFRVSSIKSEGPEEALRVHIFDK